MSEPEKTPKPREYNKTKGGVVKHVIRFDISQEVAERLEGVGIKYPADISEMLEPFIELDHEAIMAAAFDPNTLVQLTEDIIDRREDGALKRARDKVKEQEKDQKARLKRRAAVSQ